MADDLVEELIDGLGGYEKIKDLANKSHLKQATKAILDKLQNGPLDEEEVTPEDQKAIRAGLSLLLLSALKLIDPAIREPTSPLYAKLKNFCSMAFDLSAFNNDLLHGAEILKREVITASLAIIGDRRYEESRRLQSSNLIDKNGDIESGSWGDTVFKTVARSFLYLVRKKGWADLEAVAESIKRLKESQKEFESKYLSESNGIRQVAALELVSLYHLAKSMEILGEYIGTGGPADVIDQLYFHFGKAIEGSDAASIAELGLMNRWMQAASISMARSTIWFQLAAYNSKMTEFKRQLVSKESNKPLFDLLPPQREAIQEIMNVGNRALVIQMPTSSGKTLLAEFRIIQTKVNIPNSWIAYLVPTRALVNQLGLRLRSHLSTLGIQVEIASPALETDIFEDNLLGSDAGFDVLVTTPEKLDLIIRGGQLDLKKRPLGLVVLDEAHNLSDGSRGLKSELLLANLNRESPETHFLLISPFVPNAKDVAQWLDPERSKSFEPVISAEWTPNDRLVGLIYPKGHGHKWGIVTRALYTNRESLYFPGELTVLPPTEKKETYSKVRNSKKRISAISARILSQEKGTIVLAYSPTDAWGIARDIGTMCDQSDNVSPNLKLVIDFARTEYGEDFELAHLLSKGIGVHHGGISPELRFLQEWLMERDELTVLVATTTLAQGVDFPISNVILSSYYRPSVRAGYTTKTTLSPQEFWNLAGRVGRLHQNSAGLILFASGEEEDKVIEEIVIKSETKLASALEKMVDETLKLGESLNLSNLVRNDPRWSSFVQYLSHTYRQFEEKSKFLSNTEMLLKRTLAYHRFLKDDPPKAIELLKATNEYAQKLVNMSPGIATLVDSTGFSPETVEDMLKNRSSMKLSPEDLTPSNLFRAEGGTLRMLIGQMLQVRELDFTKGAGAESDRFAGIISRWVSGTPLYKIADEFYLSEIDAIRRITACSRDIYQSLSHKASWGFGAIQSLSNINYELLSDEQLQTVKTLPAMIYYGIDTVEGVLMRSAFVPRAIAVSLGKEFRKHAKENVKYTEIAKARSWLNSCPDDVWDRVVPTDSFLSGKGYKSIWSILNGKEIAN